jgi:predicted metal-binding membrane protein
MTATRTAATVPVLTLTLAAISAAFAIPRMSGMDMGAETELGSLGFFAATWVPMMAAMMLPGALPAVRRAAPLFPVAYLVVWAAVGLAVFALYEPHSTVAAGVLTIAAGLYELTPLKRECRRRCREEVGSGFRFGIYCLGSSIGLMVMLLALGVMSVAWMSVVAVLVLAQKLIPPTTAIDIPVALAIVGLGIVVAL